MEKIQQAVESIQKRLTHSPKIGLILGSGLGLLAEEIEDSVSIPYQEIPHFPVPTVEGHAGQFVFGKLAGHSVVAMQGRFHLYEGHAVQTVSLPIRVLHQLGISRLIVTNAAGGINESYEPGDLMLIEDHLNLMFQNPLIGVNEEQIGPRFPDMSVAYDKELRDLAKQVAKEQEMKLAEGVYVGVLGPSYETPAEIRMLRTLGADAVGMSTVPEVIAARHAGIKVLGISCISNMAAGILPQPLSHAEVMETGERVKNRFAQLLRGILQKIQ